MRRTWVSVALAVLAAVATLFATIGWWVHELVLDTDDFMEVVDPLVTSQQVSEAIGDRVTDEVVTALDLEERVADSLASVDDWLRSELVAALAATDLPRASDLPAPPALSQLTPALVGASRERVSQGVTDALASPAAQDALRASIAAVHRAAVAVLREDAAAMPDAVVVEGDVALDLEPLVAAVLGPVVRDSADLLGLDPATLPDRLDPDEVRDRLGLDLEIDPVVLVTREQLEPWRGLLRTFDRLVWVLVALAVALAVAAVAAAPRRPVGVAWTGTAVSVALVATWPLTGLLERAVLDRLARQGARQTVADVLTAAVSELQVAASVVVAIAVVVAVVGWWLGRSAPPVDAPVP